MSARERAGEIVVVGRRPAAEAIRARRARELLIARSAAGAGVKALVNAADRAGVPVTRVSRETIERLAGGTSHQGVVVRISQHVDLRESDLARRSWTERAVVVVLDGVTDPQNLGAIARTVEAAGADALIVRRRRGAAITQAAVKASAGALIRLPVARVTNIARAIDRLHDARFWVVGLAPDGSTSLFESTPPPGRLALVLGSEGSGLTRLVSERCDERIAIPLRGSVSSLNVSVAAGIAIFAYALRGR
ncbi:MAG: 23S rRNA (guanosine(2251)-2'-O)-methyltransferase RlmB [Actinomycetota bacterium]